MVASPTVATAAASGKRKWAEVDWEVVLEAQSFVAVYADPIQEEEEAEQATKKKAPQKKRGRKSKKAKEAEPAPAPAKRGRKAKAAEPARVSPRTRGGTSSASKKTKKKAGDEDEEGEEEAKEGEASEKPSQHAEEEAADEFWVAQLLDDVTEDMLEDDDASVRVTWLNRVPGLKKKDRYEYSFDDTIAVQAILCHVYLVELTDTVLEITPKSLKRVGLGVLVFTLLRFCAWLTDCSERANCRSSGALSARRTETSSLWTTTT